MRDKIEAFRREQKVQEKLTLALNLDWSHPSITSADIAVGAGLIVHELHDPRYLKASDQPSDLGVRDAARGMVQVLGRPVFSGRREVIDALIWVISDRGIPTSWVKGAAFASLLTVGDRDHVLVQLTNAILHAENDDDAYEYVLQTLWYFQDEAEKQRILPPRTPTEKDGLSDVESRLIDVLIIVCCEQMRESYHFRVAFLSRLVHTSPYGHGFADQLYDDAQAYKSFRARLALEYLAQSSQDIRDREYVKELLAKLPP